MDKSALKKQSRRRLSIQLFFAALVNGYAIGFAHGDLYAGASKMVCVPVLNCHSCPGALGACPIGALQGLVGMRRYSISFYVLGTLMLFGVLLGRLVCGFLCPFGLIQDLLYKIPVRKRRVPKAIDRPLRHFKYIVLLFFVLLLPALHVAGSGGARYFCKWICPAGTLEAGLPLLAQHESLRATIGWLFGWKVLLLVGIIVAAMLVSRPFCKYVCPLGAFYGLFNRFSFYQMQHDASKCVGCGACVHACPMDVDIRHCANSAECIRCGRCKATCAKGAITGGFIGQMPQEAAPPATYLE